MKNRVLTIIALVFAVILVFGLFGCTETNGPNDLNAPSGNASGGIFGDNYKNGGAGAGENNILEPPALPE